MVKVNQSDGNPLSPGHKDKGQRMSLQHKEISSFNRAKLEGEEKNACIHRKKGKRQRKTNTPFRPNDHQIISAKRAIVTILKRGCVYAHNPKDAVRVVLKKAGRNCKNIGRTTQDKSITIRRALVELIESGAISFDGYSYRLVARTAIAA